MPPLSLAASLVAACGAEADVLDLCCGIRGEYRYGKDRAEALNAQEEACAPSGEYWFASMCPVCAQCLLGTRVPTFCTRLFPVVPNVLERGYTCTRGLYPLVPRCSQRSRTRVHVYPRFVPACSPCSPAFCSHSLLCTGEVLRAVALCPGCQVAVEDPDAEPPAEPEVGASIAGSVLVPVSPEQPRLPHSALQRLGG